MNEFTNIDTGFEEEPELSDSQLERIDSVHNRVYDMCKIMTENDALEWDMSYIGEIAEFAAEYLAARGMAIRFPSVVTEESGIQYIEEYYRITNDSHSSKI